MNTLPWQVVMSMTDDKLKTEFFTLNGGSEWANSVQIEHTPSRAFGRCWVCEKRIDSSLQSCRLCSHIERFYDEHNGRQCFGTGVEQRMLDNLVGQHGNAVLSLVAHIKSFSKYSRCV